MANYIEAVEIQGDEQSTSTLAEKEKPEAPEDDRPKFEQLEAHHPYTYNGSGTPSDPFIVEFMHKDSRNPMKFSPFKKWLIVAITTLAVFAITLTSSTYTGSAGEIMAEFHSSPEVFALGISLFVLGFAVGPAFWAPLSELYGRKILFTITLAFMGM